MDGHFAERTPPDLALTEGRPAWDEALDQFRPWTALAQAGATLSAVPSTLRIPLAARAFGDQMFPGIGVGDAHASRMLSALHDDGACWLRDRASVYGILARTRRFRDLAGGFLGQHPDGHVVNLGCGLAHYVQWLDNGRARMTDADLPEVVAIRNQLLPVACERHAVREIDLTAPGWWDALGLPGNPSDAPVFLFSEGVLMYLEPEVVASILRTFGQRAPSGSVFALDAMCWLAAGRAKQHPSVRYTDAEFRWGPRRLADLTAPSPRLRLAAEYPVMEGYNWPYGFIGPAFRAWFGVPFYAVYELHASDGCVDQRR